MRAMLCHCRHHLEARDDRDLFYEVRGHLMQGHPAPKPTDEQVWEIVNTRAYDLEYSGVIADEELVYDPY